MARGGSDAAMAELERLMTRHRAIQEEIHGLTAEAGRALQIFVRSRRNRRPSPARRMPGSIFAARARVKRGRGHIRDLRQVSRLPPRGYRLWPMREPAIVLAALLPGREYAAPVTAVTVPATRTTDIGS